MKVLVEREVGGMSRQAKFWLLMVILSAGLLVWVLTSATEADAQEAESAPPEIPRAEYAAEYQQAPVVECERYGCMYSHKVFCHYTRDGQVCPPDELGIAHEALADGEGVTDRYPEGRRFVRVMWPGRYDPSRRAAWDRVAMCESTLRWDYNGPSGYDGGLQFHPNTWRAYGGTQYAPYAWQAYPAQQIDIAENVRIYGYGNYGPQGIGAWPHCGKRF